MTSGWGIGFFPRAKQAVQSRRDPRGPSPWSSPWGNDACRSTTWAARYLLQVRTFLSSSFSVGTSASEVMIPAPGHDCPPLFPLARMPAKNCLAKPVNTMITGLP